MAPNNEAGVEFSLVGREMHVTVVMPAYNGVAFIGNSVDSIISQTYHDWDPLVIDDGSTDGTLGLLRSAAERDSRITVIRNDLNRGIAASLNQGWRQASGELIARMDADDVSLPQRLEHQVGFMESHPEVDVLGTGAELVDRGGEALGLAFRPQQHEELARKMYKECPFIHPSVMVRRRFYEALNGYDEHLRRSEDNDLWLRGYKRFRFHNLQETLIRYRVSRTLSLRSIMEPPSSCCGAPIVRAAS